MPDNLAAWLNYYRDSVADGARFCPSPKQIQDAHPIEEYCLKGEQFPRELTALLIREWNGQQKKRWSGKGSAREDMAEVLVFPLVFVPNREHGQTRKNWRPVFAPIVIPATLHTNGTLAPHRNPTPWIPRDRLAPVAHEEPTIGELSEADRFATEHPEVPGTWQEVLSYADALMKAVSGVSSADLQVDDYARAAVAKVRLVNTGDERIVRSILTLYDSLCDTVPESALHGLVRHAGTGAHQAPPAQGPQLLELAAKHWATVSDRHPLAPSQRLVLAELLALPSNEVLAVQGPPGTGKTTLLKSVVAQLWVTAAVEGRPCPIVAACSANNQAVTNIIDAFASDSIGGGPWAKRWLPGVSSLGLYARSADTTGREQAAGRRFQTLSADQNGWSGFFAEYEKEDAFAETERAYLQEARRALGTDISTVEDARDSLIAQLRQTTATIQRMLAALGRIVAACSDAPDEPPEHAIGQHSGALREAVAASRHRESEHAAHCARIDSCQHAWTEHLAREPVWQVLLSWIPAVRTRRDAGRRLSLQPFAGGTNTWPVAEPTTVDAHLAALREAAQTQRAEATARANAATNALAAWEATVAEFQSLGAQLAADYSGHPAATKLLSSFAPNGCAWPAVAIESDGAKLNQLLDITLRVHAFRLATHYWEAAYLIELRALHGQKNDLPDMDQPDMREAAFRRWAKVAPCMVSTFFMLPKFFTPWPRGPQPMHGTIDLLVCDEAGQVPPEKAAASFGLARRALIVGDVLQIEPVWSVTPSVDAANAAKAGLIAERNPSREWNIPTRKAVSASAGNLMSLAQQATAVRQLKDGEGGLFLSEHRRCVPEIVAYCNHVYHGRLVPMRASLAPAQRVLPALGYASLPFRTESRGGGWRNPGEAALIAAWLHQRRCELEAYYSDQEKRTVPLGGIVAVLTPFRAQKEQLIEALDRQFGAGHGLVAGTVHALQGAERPVVIFSPVYDASHAGPYFFDQGPNMLNVAVSRAQDTFLVFGCLDPFASKRDTPASWLGRELFGAHGSEITDLPLLQAESAQQGARLVVGEQPHNELLRWTVHNARQRLVVSSPFLTRPGLEARGVLPALAAAIHRGVEVEVMVDHGFTHDDRERRSSFAEARALLLALGVAVRVSAPDRGIHAKTLIADSNVIAEGSFNWFGAVTAGKRYSRHETSLVYQGEHAGRLIEESLGALRSRIHPTSDRGQ